MIIQDRIIESEQKFNQLQEKREQYLKSAEDCQVEMTKLQGEWRLLQELLKEQETAGNKSRINKTKADILEVMPEGEAT